MTKQKERRFSMTCKEINKLTIIKQIIQRERTQVEGADLLQISVRQIKRIIKRYRIEGDAGVISKHKGGNRSHSNEFKEKVLKIVSEKYKGFRPTFATEKLQEDGLNINRETLRQLMMIHGLWDGKMRKQVKIHQRRKRRDSLGEMIQIDGSHHDWFEGRGAKCCLLVFIDDATSKLMSLRFEPGETTFGYFRCLKSYVQTHGIPLSFYSDKDSVFRINNPDKVSGLKQETQFARALKELNIELILAHSPQAKGRVERVNGVLQDRLVKELRLRGISSISEANAYLPEFIKSHNMKFSVDPKNMLDIHRKLSEKQICDLDVILSYKEYRTLSKNLEFSYFNTIYQIKSCGIGYNLRRAKVIVCRKITGEIIVMRNNKELKYSIIKKQDNLPIVNRKGADAILDKKLLELEKINKSLILQNNTQACNISLLEGHIAA